VLAVQVLDAPEAAGGDGGLLGALGDVDGGSSLRSGAVGGGRDVHLDGLVEGTEKTGEEG